MSLISASQAAIEGPTDVTDFCFTGGHRRPCEKGGSWCSNFKTCVKHRCVCKLYCLEVLSFRLFSLKTRDVRKGVEGPPWDFRVPAGRRPARAKNPAKASETHTEVTKSVRKLTKKARPDGRGTFDHLGLPRKRAH